MTTNKEPRTAEAWVVWASENTSHVYLAPSAVLEAIRRAQEQAFERGYEEGCLKSIEFCEQARRLAIEEAAQLIDAHRMGFGNEIRSLLDKK